jgi:hypothetical protein
MFDAIPRVAHRPFHCDERAGQQIGIHCDYDRMNRVAGRLKTGPPKEDNADDPKSSIRNPKAPSRSSTTQQKIEAGPPKASLSQKLRWHSAVYAVPFVLLFCSIVTQIFKKI